MTYRHQLCASDVSSVSRIKGNMYILKYKIVPLTPSIVHTSNLNVFPLISKFLEEEGENLVNDKENCSPLAGQPT